MQFPTTLGTSTQTQRKRQKQRQKKPRAECKIKMRNSLSDSPSIATPSPAGLTPSELSGLSDNCRRGPGMFSCGCETPRTKPFQMGFMCVICGLRQEEWVCDWVGYCQLPGHIPCVQWKSQLTGL